MTVSLCSYLELCSSRSMWCMLHKFRQLVLDLRLLLITVKSPASSYNVDHKSTASHNLHLRFMLPANETHKHCHNHNTNMLKYDAVFLKVIWINYQHNEGQQCIVPVGQATDYPHQSNSSNSTVSCYPVQPNAHPTVFVCQPISALGFLKGIGLVRSLDCSNWWWQSKPILPRGLLGAYDFHQLSGFRSNEEACCHIWARLSEL